MTKYREIIRLTGLGFSQRNIMASCGVAQKTVVKVQKRARELNISWPLDESMTDTELQRLMFSKESSVSQNKPILPLISRKEVGSSNRITSGCWHSARASRMRWRWPSLMRLKSRSASCAAPTSSKALCTCCLSPADKMPSRPV